MLCFCVSVSQTHIRKPPGETREQKTYFRRLQKVGQFSCIHDDSQSYNVSPNFLSTIHYWSILVPPPLAQLAPLDQDFVAPLRGNHTNMGQKLLANSPEDPQMVVIACANHSVGIVSRFHMQLAATTKTGTEDAQDALHFIAPRCNPTTRKVIRSTMTLGRYSLNMEPQNTDIGQLVWNFMTITWQFQKNH